MSNIRYIYLHGFASSPHSTKAQFFCDRFLEGNISLDIPDLNGGDFSQISLTRQLQQVTSQYLQDDGLVTLIGSSFGGLTCAWLGQKYEGVQSLILLAPAFGFSSLWLASLGEETIQQWQTSGYLTVYHYGQKRSLPLHYQFLIDAEQYPEHQLQKPIPTLILHGRNDEVIPIQNSRDYANKRPWVKLIELDSDHSLTNVMPQIWAEIKDFLNT